MGHFQSLVNEDYFKIRSSRKPQKALSRKVQNLEG